MRYCTFEKHVKARMIGCSFNCRLHDASTCTCTGGGAAPTAAVGGEITQKRLLVRNHAKTMCSFSLCLCRRYDISSARGLFAVSAYIKGSYHVPWFITNP